MARVDRLKQRLLRELVDQNVELVAGLPRKLLKRRRRLRLGSSLLGLALLPVALLASSRLFAPDLAPIATHASSPSAPSRTGAPASAVSSASEALRKPAPRPIDPSVFPLAVRRIALDPGHGGFAVGTRASSGLYEKDVTLDIARRVQRLLEASSFEVVMTRDDDRAVSLRDRARIANEARADLFVSIHLNWIAGGNTRGVETYYLGPTDDPELDRLAALENRDSGYAVADFRRLLDQVYADARQGSSRRLAESIDGALFRSLSRLPARLPAANGSGVADRGVKTAPFLVLVSTEMPAVLAEVSSLSNATEAELLTKPLYRQYIAEALARGVRRYALAAESAPEKGI
ncbi:MAG TPA: N-acetylmuramoyl-L-alanine amidase [Thermoanaerobaculia bacterium]|jgi:N-acetylmuramoyl-L-alanine amidase|nr:N-acetylmuramoyl-L-alanine amidase [Thermoanaerobaculia bacterium]